MLELLVLWGLLGVFVASAFAMVKQSEPEEWVIEIRHLTPARRSGLLESKALTRRVEVDCNWT